MEVHDFLTIVFQEAGSYSVWCPELDIASQGDTVEEALANMKEALELHIECLSPSELRELKQRQGAKLITTIDIPIPA